MFELLFAPGRCPRLRQDHIGRHSEMTLTVQTTLSFFFRFLYFVPAAGAGPHFLGGNQGPTKRRQKNGQSRGRHEKKKPMSCLAATARSRSNLLPSGNRPQPMTHHSSHATRVYFPLPTQTTKKRACPKTGRLAYRRHATGQTGSTGTPFRQRRQRFHVVENHP